jgi:hypothetical protein
MNALERVDVQLDAVKVAAEDPGAAYLIRSRLRRALLGCARAIADLQGLEKPQLPGRWTAPPAAPSQIGEVATLCSRIHQTSEHLCKPSESFDIRWERGWKLLRADLDRLQSLLRSLRDERELSASAG